MSLKALLKKTDSSNEDLLALIDRECVKKEVFDFEVVRERIARLNDYAQKEVRENDELMKLFFGVSAALYAELPRSGKVFHPSSIEEDCERQLYYEFTDHVYTDKVSRKIDGKLQRIFDVGTWWHTYIQMILWKGGVLEKSEAEVRSKRKRIGGRTDGILRMLIKGVKQKAVLEIKTMNSYSYSRGKIQPFGKHEVQSGIYARELGIDFIVFIYINKDTSEITVHVRDVKNKLVDAAFDKMHVILEAVDLKVTPPREVCGSKDDAMAKKCPFCTKCFKDPE